METLQNSKILEKKVLINRYLNNYGEISYTKLYQNLLFYFIIFFNVIQITLIVINNIINNKSLDYFYVQNIYTVELIKVGEYLFYNSISYINDFITIVNKALYYLLYNLQFNISINIPHIQLPTKHLGLTLGSYIALISSFALVIITHILVFLQTKYQLILRYCNITNYYVSLFFVISWLKRHKNNFVYIKLINKLRDMQINNTIKSKMVQKIFKKSESEYDIKFEEKDLFGFYHYTKAILIKKQYNNYNKYNNYNNKQKQTTQKQNNNNEEIIFGDF